MNEGNADELVLENNFSKRGIDWIHFSAEVTNHVETYTVPQYGDKPNDQITEWSIEDCFRDVKKRMARYGKNVREGEQLRDFLKMVHVIQIAATKFQEEQNERSSD